jgi:quinol monooxygenase YgiN
VIIAGKAHVDPADRDQYVEAFHDLIARCRAQPGCLDVAVSADPFEPGRVNIFEHWASAAELDAWRAIAPAPATDVKATDIAVSKHVVASSGPPFD